MKSINDSWENTKKSNMCNVIAREGGVKYFQKTMLKIIPNLIKTKQLTDPRSSTNSMRNKVFHTQTVKNKQ